MLAEHHVSRKEAASFLGVSAKDLEDCIQCGIVKTEKSKGSQPKDFILWTSVLDASRNPEVKSGLSTLISVAEAAKMLGMAQYRIRSLIRNGSLESVYQKSIRRLKKVSVLKFQAQLQCSLQSDVVTAEELQAKLGASAWGINHLRANRLVEVEGGFTGESVRRFLSEEWGTSRVLRNLTFDLHDVRYFVRTVHPSLQQHTLEFGGDRATQVVHKDRPTGLHLEATGVSPMGVKLTVGLSGLVWEDHPESVLLPIQRMYLKVQLRESPPKGKRNERGSENHR